MKKQIIVSLVIAIFVCLFSGCVSWRHSDQVNLEPNYQIQSLQFYNHLKDAKSEWLIRNEKVGSQVVRSICSFSRTNNDDYGYMCYADEWSYYEDPPLLDYTCFGLQGLVGLPTDSYIITVKVYVYIFDSNGELVKELSEEVEERVNAGWYYGQSQDIDEITSKALNKLIEEIPYYSKDINRQLEQAGIITNEKDYNAQRKIDSYFERNKTSKSSSSSSSSSSYTYSAPSTSSASNSGTSNVAIKQGRYDRKGTAESLSLTNGSITYSVNYRSMAYGTYKISGNRIVVSWNTIVNNGQLALANGYSEVMEIINERTLLTATGATFTYAY